MTRKPIVAVAALLMALVVTAGTHVPDASAGIAQRPGVWTVTHTAETGTGDQFATATISGVTAADTAAAFVLRRSAPDRYVRVSFSGTHYSVVLVSGSRQTVVVSKRFAAARGGGTAVARTEIRGSVVRSTWRGALVSQDVVSSTEAYTGTTIGTAVKHGRRLSTVRMSAVTSGPLDPAPTPTAPTPTAPTPTAPTPTAPTPTAPPVTMVPPVPTPMLWRSGASGRGVPEGAFAAWRGRPVDIAGTWDDVYAAQANQWSTKPGGPYADWRGDLDIAVGGIYKDRGDTWAAAASGAYDTRWRSALLTLQQSWGNRPGTLYIRFAHEFNGDWYPWSVQAVEAADFVRAWQRFRAIQRDVLPASKLVFCPNVETAGIAGLDWRVAYPGSAYVDVVSVDAYNQYPHVTTAAQFAATILRSDEYGAPGGLETHRRFAEAQGRPFAVSEWSSNSNFGDSPGYISAVHDWFGTHAGIGPGKLLYEINFNVDHGDRRFQLYPAQRQPQASGAYSNFW